MSKKVRTGDTVIVSIEGKKEIGVCKKAYTKKGIVYYNVLLERGSWLEGITNNINNTIHVCLMNLKPLSSGSKLEAKIDPNRYDFEDNSTYIPQFEIPE